jgi:DNA-binding NarL/FixJ family response regulator
VTLVAAQGIAVTDRLDSLADLADRSGSGGLDVVVVLRDERHRGHEARDIAEYRPDARVVIVSAMSEPVTIRRSVNDGAAGFVWLHEAEANLAPTIRAVAVGQLVIPFAQRRDSAPQILTTREKQILSLVVMGLRNGEIASKLYLAESTVKSHLSSAFTKLGVASRNEAAALILDPRAGLGVGILTIPTDNGAAVRTTP